MPPRDRTTRGCLTFWSGLRLRHSNTRNSVWVSRSAVRPTDKRRGRSEADTRERVHFTCKPAPCAWASLRDPDIVGRTFSAGRDKKRFPCRVTNFPLPKRFIGHRVAGRRLARPGVQTNDATDSSSTFETLMPVQATVTIDSGNDVPSKYSTP